MDKYYTPELEEFHIGFEYEWLNENNEWIKETSPTEITIKDFNKQTYGLRVKYLNKEDIESLGWFHKYDDFSFGEFIKSKNGEVDYHLTFDYENKNLIIGLYNNEDTEFYDNIFIGTIKNKSELIKLLKQLKIG